MTPASTKPARTISREKPELRRLMPGSSLKPHFDLLLNRHGNGFIPTALCDDLFGRIGLMRLGIVPGLPYRHARTRSGHPRAAHVIQPPGALHGIPAFPCHDSSPAPAWMPGSSPG